MYELSYISAANATLSEIEETRQGIISLLENSLAQYLAKDESERTPEINETIELYNAVINYVKNNLNVVIDFEKAKTEGISIKHLESLLKKSNALELPLNVFVTGYSKFGNEKEHVDMLFDQKLLGHFIAVNNYIVENGGSGLMFLEEPLYPELSWSLSQVLSANQVIDSIVETIKMHNFSPFEAATYIHSYITSQFGYKENEDNPTQPRSIIGVLNSDDIVCVGYAKFTKAIIDKLKMPGLEAETILSVIKPRVPNDSVKVLNKYAIVGFGHLQNIIKIDDPKYKIKGSYVTDACWDSKNEQFPDGKGFGNFMYPISDLMNYAAHTFIEVDKQDNFELTKKIKTDKKITFKDIPSYDEAAKRTKPIPAEKYRESIFTVYRKIYPIFNKREIDQIVDELMEMSEQVAASIFNENAKGSLARIGYENQIEAVDTKGIIK